MARLRPPEFHPVLLVIDMQNGFCSPGGSYEEYGAHIGADINIYRKIIPNIRRIIDTCHELRIPVFYTMQVREPSGIDLLNTLHRIIPKRRAELLRIPACVENTWDAEVINELLPIEGDHVVLKTRDSAFHDTELDLWLRSIYADTVIVTGVDTAICVDNTLMDAFNIGYDVILVEDATASSWRRIGQATVRKVAGSYGWVLKTDALIDLLQKSQCGPGAFRFPTD